MTRMSWKGESRMKSSSRVRRLDSRRQTTAVASDEKYSQNEPLQAPALGRKTFLSRKDHSLACGPQIDPTKKESLRCRDHRPAVVHDFNCSIFSIALAFGIAHP